MVKQRLDLLKLAIVACAVIYALVAFQLFTKNLAIDTDYPFHTHTIWAASNSFWLKDPFLAGGSYLTLSYGAPATAVGALLYPLFNVYTVAVLLVAAVPVFWYFSQQVFRRLFNAKSAGIAAIIALMNPFTVYLFLTAKLPFVWAMCFSMISLFFHLRGRDILAAPIGVLAVLTHPLAIFLFGAFLIFSQDIRGWLKPYLPALALFVIQSLVLFKPLGGLRVDVVHHWNVLFLAAVFGAISWLKKETRVPCALGLLCLGVSIIGSVFPVPFPTVYLDRVGFLFLLLLLPFLSSRRTIIVPLFAALAVGALCVHAYPVDNPVAYQELPGELVSTLGSGYVRYATDGSALYELPKLGIKFSNTGGGSFDRQLALVTSENTDTYLEMIEAENASYILVYESSPEENIIQKLGYPLIYSEDNVRVYKTHLAFDLPINR